MITIIGTIYAKILDLLDSGDGVIGEIFGVLWTIFTIPFIVAWGIVILFFEVLTGH